MCAWEVALKLLVDPCTRFQSILSVIKFVNHDISEMTTKHFEEQNKKLDIEYRKLYETDIQAWTQVSEALQKSKDPKEYEKAIKKMPRKTLPTLQKFLKDGANYQQSQIFLREMALVYMITLYKAFLHDTLYGVFCIKPNLITPYRKMTNEQIIKNVSRKELVENTEEESRKIKGFWIKSEATYLKKLFGLELTVETDWDTYAEYFQRRNMIIHNGGKPDDDYRKNTGYTGPDVKLEVNKEYLNSAVEIFMKYSTLIEEYFIKKYLGLTKHD